MRIARLRALTHHLTLSQDHMREMVEMRIARLRALTPRIQRIYNRRLAKVEMSIARLRALTSKSPVYLTGLLCDFRNEY